MIEIQNLTKKYKDVTVYENLNLSIEEGKITCVLGSSGSGKTTLLNCIAGLTEYTGKITEVKCSYVFQSPRLVPNLTVLENLKLICKEEDRPRTMLDLMRISDKINAYPKQLSGGQAQRVSVARAFLYDADIILMDEPFSSLDLKLKREISLLFKNMQRESSATALFVTHDVDEAVEIADRIVVIEKGEVLFDADFAGEDKGKIKNILTAKLCN